MYLAFIRFLVALLLETEERSVSSEKFFMHRPDKEKELNDDRPYKINILSYISLSTYKK